MKKIFNNKKFLLISLFICFSLFLCTFIRKDSDYFWHIKVGEYMYSHGVLLKDIFSFSATSKYWMSHEWLFEIFIYSLKNIFGNYSMIIYPFVSLFLIYLFIYKSNGKNMEKNLLFTVIWIVFSSIFMPYIQARPHFMSYVLFSIVLYLIFDLIRNDNSKKIFFIPLITVLWSNLHGGSSNLGYLFCFFTVFIGLFKFKYSKIEAKRLNKKQISKLLIVGISSIICTGINPHGFKMTIYPYTNLMDNLMIKAIAEWAPTNINDSMHYPFFVVGVIILFILLFSKKKINFYHFALYGIGLYLGLKSIRFWPYLYIISSFFVFDYVSEYNLSTIKFIYTMLYTCLVIIFLFSFKDNYKNINKEYLYLNSKIVNKIKEEKPKRLFNMYDTGGELVYHDIKVFIDGRADLYSSSGVLKDYLNLISLDENSEELLNYYNFDYYLVSEKSRIDYYLSKNNSVELIINSKKYNLYKKKISSN